MKHFGPRLCTTKTYSPRVVELDDGEAMVIIFNNGGPVKYGVLDAAGLRHKVTEIVHIVPVTRATALHVGRLSRCPGCAKGLFGTILVTLPGRPVRLQAHPHNRGDLARATCLVAGSSAQSCYLSYLANHNLSSPLVRLYDAPSKVPAYVFLCKIV